MKSLARTRRRTSTQEVTPDNEMNYPIKQSINHLINESMESLARTQGWTRPQEVTP